MLDAETGGSSPSSLAALYAALAKAQGEFSPISKNRVVEIPSRRTGEKFTFKYADLEEVISATRPALVKHGLAVVQRIQPAENSNQSYLVTVLAHESGGMLESRTALPPDNYGDLKNLGAAITYLRRYAYCAMLCVAADDDLDEDGTESGEVRQPAAKAKQQGPTHYPAEDFHKNLPAWKNLIESGKTTPDDLIKKISTKGQLSLEQIATIKALAKEDNQ